VVELDRAESRAAASPERTAGDRATVSDKEGHEHDWRFNGRRQDQRVEIICVAEGHDVNAIGRIGARIISDKDLPKYDGFADI
jgi:hypothetical protein